MIRLPYPPTVNLYWRHNRGRTHISTEGVRYRELVGWALQENRQETMHGRLKLTLWVYPPDKRRRDLDNVLKAILDSLAHAGLYKDDSQVDWLDVRRMAVVKDGLIKVEAEELGESA